MNTTMAPVDELRRSALGDLERRQEMTDRLSIRRRDGGGGGGNGGGNGGGGGGDGKNGNKNKDSGDNDYPPDGSYPSKKQGPPPPPPLQTIPSSPIIQLTTDAPSPAAATITVPTTLSSVPSPIVPQVTPSFFSTESPTTTTALLEPTTVSSLFPSSDFASTSGQPRKGLDPDDYSTAAPTTSTTKTKTKTSDSTTTAFISAQAESAAPSTTSLLPLPTDGLESHHIKHNDLSPTAEHLLIAAGTIGAVIIVAAVVYFLIRMKQMDMFSALRKNVFGFLKRDSSSGPGSYAANDVPPPYGYMPDEKNVPQKKQFEGYFTQFSVPALATPQKAATLSRQDSQRKEQVRDEVMENPSSFGLSAAPERTQQTSSQSFYITQQSGLSRQASDTMQLPQPAQQSSTQAFYNTQEFGLSRQASDATQNTTQAYYGGGGGGGDTYNPLNKNLKYLSELSSLSSGFGDQIIIPEPMEPKGLTPRQSYRQSRFSWAPSQGPLGQRDTVYTATSVESAPRFRTINSWVNQQSDRVERRQQMANEVPNMPEIPASLIPGGQHQRNLSENAAFRQHPGDEIEISKGTRVPSSILDNTTRIN